jgi:membrane protein DedA with SNARE-associated domain
MVLTATIGLHVFLHKVHGLLQRLTFEHVKQYIGTVGYPALFGLLFACGLGLPLPEDIPLMISGALIAQGSMRWPIAAVCAWFGIIGGDICLYTIGRVLGRAVTKTPVLRAHITEQRLDKVEGMFHQYGVGVIAVGRLFAGIRGAMVICAGTIRFNFLTFIIADGLAAVVSGGLWMSVGHWLGANLTPETIEHYKDPIMLGLIVVGILFVLWIVWKHTHRKDIVENDVKIIEKVGGMKEKVMQKIHRSETSTLTPPAPKPNLQTGNETPIHEGDQHASGS